MHVIRALVASRRESLPRESALERLTANSESALADMVRSAKQLSVTTMRWASSHEFVNGFINPATDKVAAWQPQIPDVTSMAPDTMTTGEAPPPSIFCDVSGL